MCTPQADIAPAPKAGFRGKLDSTGPKMPIVHSYQPYLDHGEHVEELMEATSGIQQNDPALQTGDLVHVAFLQISLI